MNSYTLFEYVLNDADQTEETSKVDQLLQLPFNESVLEGGSMSPQHAGVELVAILSSN